MRLEYTLIGFDKIKAKLGTVSPLELTDEVIAQFLNESIAEDVFKPINKYISRTNKELSKQYRNLKKQYKRGYIREFAHYANSSDTEVFDMQQVLDIAKNDMNKSKNGTYNKRLIDSIMSSQFKGNFKKLEEFRSKFQITQ